MFSSGRALCASYLLALVTVAFSLPSSFPHVYPGQPAGDYSPSWQSYFQVTRKLPNVNFDIGRSFAGNLPVQRAGHPNNTLFFWGFEKKVGSLTNAASSNKDPWAIWLNGGPGSSSMHGLFFENGPIHIKPDYSLEGNQYSWNKLVDYFWIDQPVGVGFATADADGYVNNEDMVGEDFLGFLTNLVKVFPGLKNRPLILTGESYAGVYIPNILKAYFNTPNPPVTISKIAIGDGSYTNEQTFEQAPATTIVETYPQIVGYDKDVFKYLEKMSSLCQYDVKLTYPQQGGIIPAIPLNLPTGRDIPWKFRNQLSYRKFFQALQARQLEKRDVRIRGRQVNSVDKSQFWVGRSNDTLDPWYGCLVLDLALDYAVNYTLPYNIDGGFNVYDITDATSPSVKQDASKFMNDATVRAALHAPTSKNWTVSFRYVFGETSPEGAIQERSPEPMNWFSEMATNATAKNIGVILFSGNNDALIPHWGTEIAIQNTTFGGIQGFTVKPSTPWYSNGKFAGIIRQERGWTYALFDKAGHMVPLDQPATAYTFLKQFVLGNDQTGLVIKTPSGAVKVVGGTDPKLAEDILPGEDAIWYGQGTKASSYIYPKATRTAWSAFIKTETASPKPTSTRRP